jgi:hypothetical protein
MQAYPTSNGLDASIHVVAIEFDLFSWNVPGYYYRCMEKCNIFHPFHPSGAGFLILSSGQEGTLTLTEQFLAYIKEDLVLKGQAARTFPMRLLQTQQSFAKYSERRYAAPASIWSAAGLSLQRKLLRNKRMFKNYKPLPLSKGL